jgi:hypothetical protein
MTLNWTNVTSLGDVPRMANDASGGSFWTAMLYMIWIILIMLFISFGLEVALIAASFIALIIGVLLVYGGLVAWQYMLTFVGVLLLMFLYVTWSSTRGQR